MRATTTCMVLLCLLAPARAEDVPGSGSNFGGVGLLEMRNARFRDDATLELGASWRDDRQFWFLQFQATPWLETTFRFTQRLNATAGTGQTSDRAFDMKIRLLSESRFLPAVAIGAQDMIGTGIYAGEYIVASKRFGAFDVTLGLGWGRPGSADDLDNPFFGARAPMTGEGGRLRLGNFFHGDMALFGGVEYTLPDLGPVRGLRLKLELSGDALRDERRNGRGAADSRVNAGLAWAPVPWLDIGVSYVNGSDVLARLSMHLNAAHPPPPPLLQHPPPMAPRPALPPEDAGARIVVPEDAGTVVDADAALPAPTPPAATEADPRQIRAALRRAGFRLHGLHVAAGAAQIAVSSNRYRTLPQAMGRVIRAVQPLLPASVERVELGWWRNGVEIGRAMLPRNTMEDVASGAASIEEARAYFRLSPATGALPARNRTTAARQRFAAAWAVSPRLDTMLMDPSAPLRVDLRLAASARVQMPWGLSAGGSVSQSLFNTFADAPPSDSVLPHVRSDIARYATEGRTAMETLTVEGIWNVAPDVFARLTAGYLEPMYAGVSAEALWRPVDAWYGVGADINAVQQRDYSQGFGLRNYRVVSGHVSFHADLPWYDLGLTLRAGRYLAGDWGATVELARRFDNGIEVGAFATLTDVPFSQYGEGSFDKGIYLRFPFDLFGRPTASQGRVLVRPLLRDGGQRLQVEHPLWDITRQGRQAETGRALPMLAQ